MKHKSQLRIIEQTIMILVFAIAAAICLKAFLATSEISGAIRLKDLAVTQVQNTAEILKATHGDYEKAAERLNGKFEENRLVTECEGFSVYARPAEGEGRVPRAVITAEDKAGNKVFEVTAAWQEELK